MTKTITLITSEMKKGKPDTKELPAEVIELGGSQRAVILSDRKQKLDKSKRIHPDVGNMIVIDGIPHLCTHFMEIGCPKYYQFIVIPL